jgi:diaminohydroxyphosphoribosylaminopyrimidine deaminase/5-amino-6-(5-phosphoribosylamino)uracil reductase
MRQRNGGGEDRVWMGQALALAAVAEGTTSPNPRVGCVLVRNGRVVGRGFHQAAGGPHAEVVAIREAGDRARGATLYVSLEPCAHHGRTPPCADLVPTSGVTRVVVAMRDPNPLVDGRGLDRLRRAGLRVDVGTLAEEAERLNAPFAMWHRRARPLVTLKAALSLDGLLSAERGRSRWITSPAARRFAHRLRLRSDAVLVGAGTARSDNPRLTVRLPGAGRQPLRVIVSGSLELAPDARIFEGGEEAGRQPRIYTIDGSPASLRRRLERKARIVSVGSDAEGRPDLRAVLQHLADEGVQSVLVEGGGATIHSFLAAGLADRAALFYAPKIFGARGATPLADGPAVREPLAGLRIEERSLLSLGEDLVVLGRVVGGGEAGGVGGTGG